MADDADIDDLAARVTAIEARLGRIETSIAQTYDKRLGRLEQRHENLKNQLTMLPEESWPIMNIISFIAVIIVMIIALTY